jgi:hypothetical protein
MRGFDCVRIIGISKESSHETRAGRLRYPQVLAANGNESSRSVVPVHLIGKIDQLFVLVLVLAVVTINLDLHLYHALLWIHRLPVVLLRVRSHETLTRFRVTIWFQMHLALLAIYVCMSGTMR